MAVGGTLSGAVAIALLSAFPAAAAGPHKGGTYGGGWIEDLSKIRPDRSLSPGEREDKRAQESVRSIVSLKVSATGDTVDGRLRAKYRCPSEPRGFDTTGPVEFGSAAIDGEGRFSARVPYSRTDDDGVERSGTATVKGKFNGGKARGKLKLTLKGGGETCRLLEERWQARDVAAPRRAPRNGKARRDTPYYGTNETIQDIFDAAGAPGPFMLRTARKKKRITHAFMRALWTCTGPNPAAGAYFENIDFVVDSKISKRGKFKKVSTVKVDDDDGTVTTFRTDFRGRFRNGKVEGTWRSSMESATLTCDTGRVSWKALP